MHRAVLSATSVVCAVSPSIQVPPSRCQFHSYHLFWHSLYIYMESLFYTSLVNWLGSKSLHTRPTSMPLLYLRLSWTPRRCRSRCWLELHGYLLCRKKLHALHDYQVNTSWSHPKTFDCQALLFPSSLYLQHYQKEDSHNHSDTALQMVVKSISNTVWSVGIVPTLFLFDLISRLHLPTNFPTPSNVQRLIAGRRAT